ncbi:hypothetical protein DMP23_19725 [Amycolatopsis sp. A1MSW2902]|uniref:DUF4129 domain-containing protein n=1 Tax=Amycolatopsis sp. A1MSW2902 TaxID=687413 RepID=UPI00307EDE31
MRRLGDAAPSAAVLAVGVLLALGAAGLRARAGAGWSCAGPLVRAAGTTTIVVVSVLVLACALLILWASTALRRRRKPEDDDFEPVYEPLGAKWGRRWAVLVTLAVTVAPIVVLAVVASRVTPAATPPPPVAPAAPPAPVSGGPADGGPPWLLLAVLAGAVLALAVFSRMHGKRTPGTASSPALAAAAEAGRSELGEIASGGPRGAILRSFAAMERALAGSDAAPRPADTPTAVLSRAADAGLVRSGPARRLLGVFAEARFSTHEMTEAHRDTARRALDELLGDLGRKS